MRGLPGAGKSTYLRSVPDAHTVSADDYFIKNGEYVFDPTKLGEAYATCFRRFMQAIQLEMPVIAVDNTNVSVMEMSPYYLAAKAFGYEVDVVEVYPTVTSQEEVGMPVSTVLAHRNTHGVPEGAIERMMDRWEVLPRFWEYTYRYA